MGAVTEWVTVRDLTDSLGVMPAETEGQTWAVKSCDATNAFIARRRPDLPAAGTDPADDAYADIRLGAALLAQAVYQRRGVGAEADIYTYPAKLIDANVTGLLGLTRPVFA